MLNAALSLLVEQRVSLRVGVLLGIQTSRGWGPSGTRKRHNGESVHHILTPFRPRNVDVRFDPSLHHTASVTSNTSRKGSSGVLYEATAYADTVCLALC